MNVVDNFPPKTPVPFAKVVEDSIPGTGGRLINSHLPETVRNGPGTVESSILDIRGVLPSRHLPGTKKWPCNGQKKTVKNPNTHSLDHVATPILGND